MQCRKTIKGIRCKRSIKIGTTSKFCWQHIKRSTSKKKQRGGDGKCQTQLINSNNKIAWIPFTDQKPEQNQITIYGYDTCPYAIRAADLAVSKQMSVKYYKTDDMTKIKTFLSKIPGLDLTKEIKATSPIVFKELKYIGGCDQSENHL
jgi:glutaredoxin